MKDANQLARKISLPLLVFYGLGVILGAGIYVLVGKVAGEAGVFAPLSFAVAACIATITAFSYSDLVNRFPKSAGEVVYVNEGLKISWLSRFVGWIVVLSGLVSSATILNGFAGYMKEFVSVSDELIIIVITLVLTSIAIWGVAESVWMAAIMTCVEILGLLIVLYFTKDVWPHVPEVYSSNLMTLQGSGVCIGAFLAFYAFVGFEDMVNVVEEVKNPEKNMKRAILLAMAISTLIYILVAIVSVVALPLNELVESEAPLSAIVKTRSPLAAKMVSIIGLFAVVNGALIQMVMGSRVLYGMSRENLAPRFLADVNSITKTPIKATIVVSIFILIFALGLPLVTLAKFTSFAVLFVFILVNLSLFCIRLNEEGNQGVIKKVFWPLSGAILSLTLIALQFVFMK